MDELIIKSIQIELEIQEKDLQSHASTITFQEGMWYFSGPVYSRITPVLHDIWKLLRGAMQNA